MDVLLTSLYLWTNFEVYAKELYENVRIDHNLIVQENDPDKPEQSTKGRKYMMPKIMGCFPFKKSPFSNRPEIKEWDNWLNLYCRTTLKNFKDRSVLKFFSTLFPFCDDINRFESINKSCGVFPYFDDFIFENQSTDMSIIMGNYKMVLAQIVQMLQKLEGHQFVSMKEWSPLVLATYAVLEEICGEQTKYQNKRMMQIWNLYIQGLIKEMQFLDKDKMSVTYEDFVKMRLSASGLFFSFHLFEYGNQMILSEDLMEEPRIKRLICMAVYQILLVNDIHSFERELRSAADITKMINLVAIITIWKDIPIEMSMNKVSKMIAQIDKDIIELEQELLNDKLCYHGTKQLIDWINHFIGGHFQISQTIDRFHKFD